MPRGLRKKSSAALRPASQAASSIGCRDSQESLRAPELIATVSGDPAPPRPNAVRRKNVLVPKDAWQLAHVLLDYYGDPGLVAQAFEGLADFRSQHLARFEWMTIASRYREAGTVGSHA